MTTSTSTTKKTKSKLPPTDGTLTMQEYREAIRAAGLGPKPVWESENGVKLSGPHHRPYADASGMVVRVRSYYRMWTLKRSGLDKRQFPEFSTRAEAMREARELERKIAEGPVLEAAPNRTRTVNDLIDAYLAPSNHLEAWNSPRSAEAPATFLNTWARPVIGHLPCSEWDARGSERILEQMAKCNLKLSYRSQGYTYLVALATFARMRRHGFLPPHADPLDEVNRPNLKDDRKVDARTLPTLDHIAAFAANLGDVAAAKSIGRLKNPDETRLQLAELERFRWSMLPMLIFGGGLRPNEALALRTGDFDLSNRTNGLGLYIERQADRSSSTGTRPPKHGSKRTTYVTDKLWDDVVRLVSWIEAQSGRNALVWPRLREPDHMLDDSTLHRAYFIPAAERTAGFTSELIPQWTVVEGDDIDERGHRTLITVPLINKSTSEQRTKRVWNWSWRHFRHLYGTTALAPVDTGGWGQDIADVAEWMGHRSSQTTWEYYIGTREGSGARMAAGSASARTATPPSGGAARVAAPASRVPSKARSARSHLRVVS
jgi:integrase